MSTVVCVMGESGSGKTTAMRNLPPEQTCYIDADGKGLSWRGWRKQYSVENKNYARTDFPETIKDLLIRINTQMPNIHYVVIDTLNGIMVGEEMRYVKVNGFGKWTDLAANVYNIIDTANRCRDDLAIIFLAHTQTVIEENGFVFTHIKTNGRKLEKIVLESKFTTVLWAKHKESKYIFETQNEGDSTAKSPKGAFETREIDNDIMPVLEVLAEF